MTPPKSSEAEIVSYEDRPWDQNRDPKIGTVWTAKYGEDSQVTVTYTVTETSPGMVRMKSLFGDVLTMTTGIFQMNFLHFIRDKS